MTGSRVIDRGLSAARALMVGSAIDDSDLDVYEFRVYAHLKRRAGDGMVWEKQEQMAAICKMSRKKVNEVLASLEEKGWIEQEQRKHKGQQSSNMIYLLEPPCMPKPSNPELHGQVTESYTAVSPTVTAKGIPLEGNPKRREKREEAKLPARPKPAQKTLREPQSENGTPPDGGAADAARANTPILTGQDDAPSAGNEPGHDKEDFPGGGAAAGGPNPEVETYIRKKLSTKFVDSLLEEVQPLGVNRQKDWFSLPLERVKDIFTEAVNTHRNHDVKVPTRVRDLLDQECQRAGLPPLPDNEPLDAEGDPLESLLAGITPNGRRGARR